MDNIILNATDRTPQVLFHWTEGKLAMRGESYPENAAAFFGPLHQSLKQYLEGCAGQLITFDIELSYFNSSSAKAIMNLFQLLEAAAKTNGVVINWCYQADDDTMQEFGEDFAADFARAVFNLCPRE
jgi:hypothetical protein